MNKKNSAPQGAEECKKTSSDVNTLAERKPLGKIDRILLEFRRGAALNRFEAERLGDHCLNSTVAVLRAEGWLIIGEWETVPTRFGKTARVLRYRLVGFRNPSEIAEEVAEILGNGAGAK
ncbi:helix-turn-helix domain-containing protein [Burkholderia gladioli]|uniref:helix-turn-helix domain-containing protein n=1 Tax=Burkholderia gladioli TaxID=28095 RepID=UPI001FC88816|nr:hypothetical protein [Burkholderia gladioli]